MAREAQFALAAQMRLMQQCVTCNGLTGLPASSSYGDLREPAQLCFSDHLVHCGRQGESSKRAEVKDSSSRAELPKVVLASVHKVCWDGTGGSMPRVLSCTNGQ